MSDFHMPGGWYEPPPECECEDDDCSCEQKAQDAYDDAFIARDDAEQGR